MKREPLEEALATLGELLAERSYREASHLPEFLAEEVTDVGTALGLGGHWLNTGPAGVWDFGLPAGLEGRVGAEVDDDNL